MKISQSAVAMAGSSSYSHYQESTITSVLVRPGELEAAKKAQRERQEQQSDEGVEVSISNESQSLLEDLMAERKKSAEEQQNKMLARMLGTEKSEKPDNPGIRVSSKNEQMLKTLKQMLEMLNRIRKSGKGLTGARQMSSYPLLLPYREPAYGIVATESDAEAFHP